MGRFSHNKRHKSSLVLSDNIGLNKISEVLTMAHKIIIKYTAPVAPNAQAVAPICRCFYPSNCAADHPSMAGTYYDTNVEGWGEGTSLEEFMQNSVAHPGLVAALKLAVREGQATFNEADDKAMLYIKEVENELASQGFTFVIDGEDAG